MKFKICVICHKKYSWRDSRGKTCSFDCYRILQSKLKMGEKNPRFNNGWRQYVNKLKHIKKCQICGNDKELEIHHKDKNIRNNDINNLIKLCRRCHMLIDGRFKNLNFRNSDVGLCGGNDDARMSALWVNVVNG
jgi:hypothetical protein